MKDAKRVWLKVDACDIKQSLQESQRGEWNGDVDLCDGKLDELWSTYQARLAVLPKPKTEDFHSIINNLTEDLTFLQAGLQKAVQTYQSKMKGGNQQAILDRCWDVAEYNLLFQQCQHFLQLYKAAIAKPEEQCCHTFTNSVEKYREYLRGLFKRKRSPASHILVVLASDEQRCTKPYCVPLQYIPCTTVKDEFIREVTSVCTKRLHEKGITVVGTTTDGEYTTLR